MTATHKKCVGSAHVDEKANLRKYLTVKIRKKYVLTLKTITNKLHKRI
jgi:hypothetical protein